VRCGRLAGLVAADEGAGGLAAHLAYRGRAVSADGRGSLLDEGDRPRREWRRRFLLLAFLDLQTQPLPQAGEKRFLLVVVTDGNAGSRDDRLNAHSHSPV
jgi:hypothetical protein